MKKSQKPKTVCGIGINDADYVVQPTIHGKRVWCHFYRAWKAMLERCYLESDRHLRSTYIEATVCEEWKTFSKFRSWMIAQDWQDKQLDKDIIIPGNKHYSPQTCCFVSQAVNVLLINNAARRGKYPNGVCWHKQNKKYLVQCGDKEKKRKNRGYYDTVEEAFGVYCRIKSEIVKRKAKEEKDHRIKSGLYKHAELIASGVML